MGLTSSPWPLAGAFLWGAAEGSFFFLLPDILLTWTALSSVRNAGRQIAACLAGAVLAGALMYGWSARGPQARQMVEQVPFVRDWMFKRAAQDLAAQGAWSIASGPARGIPYKVYAVLAPERISLGEFLGVTLPARLWRFLCMTFVFALVGHWLRGRDRAALLPWLHGFFWIALYAWYWSHV